MRDTGQYDKKISKSINKFVKPILKPTFFSRDRDDLGLEYPWRVEIKFVILLIEIYCL